MDELEITPTDVKARMDRGEQLVLIDVREPWEHQVCRIEGAKLVPLGSLAASLQTLPDVDEVRSEEHTSELQSQSNLVCRLLLEKKTDMITPPISISVYI